MQKFVIDCSSRSLKITLFTAEMAEGRHWENTFLTTQGAGESGARLRKAAPEPSLHWWLSEEVNEAAAVYL